MNVIPSSPQLTKRQFYLVSAGSGCCSFQIMRLLLAIRSLPFLPIKFGQVPPQEAADLIHGSPRPQFARRASVSTITESITDPPITTTITVLTFVTPSPSAPAIPITSQGQIVTSYVPKLTVCPIVSYGAEQPYKKRQEQTSSSAYYFSNLSMSLPPSPSCSILYSPTISPVCHTTLTPLGGIPITVTACSQKIAFRTDYGLYTSLNGSVELVPTTYIATWDSAITGVPTGLVEAAVCPQDGTCTTFTESWYTDVFGAVSTTSTVVDISSVLTGVSTQIIP